VELASGLPAEEVIDLFNTFSRLPPSEVTKIAQAEWRLRQLLKDRRYDTAISVAYLQSLEMLGKAPEAIAEAERLWYLRNSMEGQELAIYLTQLGNLAMYEKAAEIFDLVKARGAIGCLTNAFGTELSLAWAIGDADKFSAALQAATPEAAVVWGSFVSKIEAAGLLPHLAGRQKIVQELTFGRQCLTRIILSIDDEGETDFSHHVYAAATYEDRMDLEEEIETRLDRYFAAVGLCNSEHWNLITEIVLPITAAPSSSHEFKNAVG
jgi:hypothetical protein